MKLLQTIGQCLLRHEQPTDSALLTGSSGRLLSALLISKVRDIDEEQLVLQLEGLISYPATQRTTTFCYGHAGLNWFYSELERIGIITAGERRSWSYGCDHMHESAMSMIRQGNYDYLHGAGGIIYQLLNHETSLSHAKFSEFLVAVGELMGGTGEIIRSYDLSLRGPKSDEINLSLSHGVVSVLKLCVRYHQKGIAVPLARQLAQRICEYLYARLQVHSALDGNPVVIALRGEQKPSRNRLAWCYGDLSLGYILLQAGKEFNWDHISSFASALLESTTKRREFTDTLVIDAQVCHGSAGIAHMYNRLYADSGSQVFLEASDFWISQTKNMSIPDKPCAGYRRYDAIDDQFIEDFGLLEGLAGIGLVLYSHESRDFSWDQCLMLD